MDRTVLLVDAGYLLAASGNPIFGTSRRNELVVRTGELLQALTQYVARKSKLPLVRTHWYDATVYDRLTQEHRLTREQEGVRNFSYSKLKFGRLVGGQQKGVDALIYRDLTMLARQGSVVSAYLLASDEDLREAVAEEQSSGIQVTLITVQPADTSIVAEPLIWEARTPAVLMAGGGADE